MITNQINEVSTIHSNEFLFDPSTRIFTARAADLSPSVDLFFSIDADQNRGFILDFNGNKISMVVDEILPDTAGWIYYPKDYDASPIAVFIDNT